jgi:hypothetical protein
MPIRKRTLAKEIRAISIAFNQLARSFARLAPVLASAGGPGALAPAPAKRRKPRLTTAQRAALKLQGRYMGTLRGLKPTQKAKVKKIRAQKGIRAAIAAARRLASRS